MERLDITEAQRVKIRRQCKYGAMMAVPLMVGSALTPLSWTPWLKGTKRSSRVLASGVSGFLVWPILMDWYLEGIFSDPS